MAASAIRDLTSALEIFRIDTDRYPTTQEGLQALVNKPRKVKGWRGPHIVHIPPDPWGHPYPYRYLGADRILIASYGADGNQGGKGDNTDIVNETNA